MDHPMPLLVQECYDPVVRRFSIMAWMMVALVALAVSCGPLCQRQMCAHSCCAGHCSTGVNQSPVPECVRVVALPVPSFSRDGLMATSVPANMAGAEVAVIAAADLLLPERSGARATGAPAPPLRI